ncbi:response regulator transcription factor [Paraburkholderia sp. J12]|uniref:response regulator transcription factor n=1 Tax=Paraburkholderia sp. J12 TaxID=2805432 RepID=UPI002ABDE3DF|nr:response regulator transcription factor [Paraburkholderia sp. J12]
MDEEHDLAKILLLEESRSEAEFLQLTLRDDGHEVRSFQRGTQAIRYLENSVVDLLLLDWHVSDISGLDVLGWVRHRIGRELPVLFITQRTHEDELVLALNAGADDYMIKPIRTRELTARVKSLLRRAYPDAEQDEKPLELGRYRIDPGRRIILLDNEFLDLTPKEFDLAVLLFRNMERVIPRDTLIARIWGREPSWVSRSLDTHIHRLRTKLRLGPENGLRLRAVYTHGYRMELASEPVQNLLPPDPP